jgi:hypothetical protein
MVMPVRRGESRQVTGGIEPVWSADGKHLLFLSVYRKDAYVIPLKGGAPAATGLLAALEQNKLTGTPEIGAWSGDRIIVAAQTGDSRNLWRLTLDPRSFRVTGSPERLTFGASAESHPAIGGGRMLFSSVQENPDIWYLPLKSDEAKVTGELTALPRR